MANAKRAAKPKAKPAAKKPVAKSVGKSKPAAKKPAPSKPKAKATKSPAKPAPKKAPPKPASKAAIKPVAKASGKAAPKAAATRTPMKAATPSPVATQPAPAKSVAPSQPGVATKPASRATPSPARTVEPPRPAPAPAFPEGEEVPVKQARVAPKPGSVRLISEEELLKMPAKDYMNDLQLEFFRHRLVAMRDEIIEKASDTQANLKEYEFVADTADRATQEEEHALELRTRDRERKLLKKIEQSLGRIEDGSYGWCDETGEPIGIPRLLARPTATLSLEAQEKRERMEKLFA